MIGMAGADGMGGAVSGGVIGSGAVVGVVRAAGLESALPGEWAAFLLTIGVIALVGAGIIVATCLRHEQVVARRNARRRGGEVQGRVVDS